MDTSSCKVKLCIRPVEPLCKTCRTFVRSRPAVPRNKLGRLKIAAQRDPGNTMEQDLDSRDGLGTVLKTLLGAFVIASASSVAALPALAYTADGSQSGRDWKPRRHHRRLEDRQRTVDLGARSKAGQACNQAPFGQEQGPSPNPFTRLKLYRKKRLLGTSSSGRLLKTRYFADLFRLQ